VDWDRVSNTPEEPRHSRPNTELPWLLA
jgi:hypothetical protein